MLTAKINIFAKPYDLASPWSLPDAMGQTGDSRPANICGYHTYLNSSPLKVTDAAGNKDYKHSIGSSLKMRVEKQVSNRATELVK
ncbi:MULTISPECIES: hypothetical protein [Serratia]|uniref:Uncharacterized protein n=2 Tax=Serratia TaxID=613 RepID=A0ABT7GDC2_9GAMM|nr:MULTISPECIES: hypothetical protein [Serratia]EGT3594620.1 hypothetical protein [Serratia marcescens]MDK4774926.1 hypothetical protein [Serratia nevei]MDK4795742.1 hypothetical protein [Serratia nevei]MDK4938255.1 hypothetical protein [Serratia nevei]MDK5062420.1 hypothetical protein [Serratia nevei]